MHPPCLFGDINSTINYAETERALTNTIKPSMWLTNTISTSRFSHSQYWTNFLRPNTNLKQHFASLHQTIRLAYIWTALWFNLLNHVSSVKYQTIPCTQFDVQNHVNKCPQPFGIIHQTIPSYTTSNHQHSPLLLYIKPSHHILHWTITTALCFYTSSHANLAWAWVKCHMTCNLIQTQSLENQTDCTHQCGTSRRSIQTNTSNHPLPLIKRALCYITSNHPLP